MASRIVKQVIVVRKDLNMRKGKMVAQGAHASIAFLTKDSSLEKRNVTQHGEELELTSFSNNFLYPSGFYENLKEWIDNGFTKICVSVDSEEELLEIHRKALDAGLVVNLITDSGFTEFNGVPTNTCLAIGPALNEEIDKITSHLKLL
jgi:PTH2 family peptidyl-tRNA hydrolase